MSPRIIYEPICLNVRRILINRPAKRNAINLETFKQLQETLRIFEEEDDSAHVAVLAGSEGMFCSGYDLKEIVNKKSGLPELVKIKQMLLPLGARLTKRKPIVAAIEGHAVGFGYELALRCDFRIADRDSRMGFLNRRFGIPIMNGGTVILPHLIGQARARDLIATGRAQQASEAMSFGLVQHVCDIGCAQGRATNFARSISKFDQTALLQDLDNMDRVNRTSNVLDLLHHERQESLEHLKTCKPLEVAVKFLEGELCRHGSTDVGNILTLEPEMTL